MSLYSTRLPSTRREVRGVRARQRAPTTREHFRDALADFKVKYPAGVVSAFLVKRCRATRVQLCGAVRHAVQFGIGAVRRVDRTRVALPRYCCLGASSYSDRCRCDGAALAAVVDVIKAEAKPLARRARACARSLR